MAALVLALILWRNDVVRLLPQTASFYRLVGLDVNLRGLAFKDIKITYETVDAKPVLVIEGMIVGQSKEIGPEAMREQMYNTFLKYRDPRPESSVAPEVEPSTKTA